MAPQGRSRFIGVIAVVLPVFTASAQHLIPEGVANRLDESEIESIETYIGIALDTLRDQGELPWISSNNRARGNIRLVRSLEVNLQPCRELEVTIAKGGYTDYRTLIYCLDEDLFWHSLTHSITTPQ